MSNMLTPFVYWAQTESKITLKVDLTDVEHLDVDLNKTTLQVIAYGHGARGMNSYSFDLNLHSSVDPNKSSYKIKDRQVDFVLRKNYNGWWPRLTSQPQKPSWLKIDFDKWKSEDMDDNEDEKRNILNDYPDMYDKLHKEEFGYRKEDFTKVYLVIYNLCQFVGFIYVFAVMAIKYSRDGPDSMKETFDAVGNPLKFIQLLQFLEIMHPLFGYTKSSVLVSFLQTGGRGFMLFCMIDAEPRMQTKPVVFYLFLIWSTVEIIRYPYYITQLLNIKISFLTWLRYTIWIPLYPLGFICEGIIMLRNIPYFEETQKFTISLPNSYNFAFHFPTLIRLYLLFLLLPGIYTVMSRMNQLRSKKLKKSYIKKKYN
ncbi:PREDICTED: very-long-chain (3R)-3-hydroxyacyl-CoA dehydratase isoform X1 [Cyphomyrmex costatus]|uniref:Very-long-chain (3R)-3-hydroxyacyl-CoA dehydratase n=1 Tax=Cyphomyrmex costatus TaxID=456900 RepID=A0A151IFW3_9HYME|nr:PREDICTED: very-long-chain (3R)-3-hydroxyacyl-CoA dehydratase isoform X1 [Cyphomyrmex costatus]XP_018398382.1 PREDICTED: very-long-chain (3R)-3-hydroxyacyl-CoA dehydratase isoform X1 [Cyphomyrmex costatus]KYN00031.1 3-hydroxyacyl-CoA dehydratase [Cyphomyrmex costatus]